MPEINENDYREDFFKAVLTLNNVDECRSFFGDVCTSKEVATFSQRLAVAKKLKQNKVYTDIVKETGASTATISRVKRAIETGDTFDMIFERMNDDE